jgi:hypothetical protein
MQIRYPDYSEITDPTPRLPTGVATDIQGVITQAIARWRKSKDSPEATVRRIESWGQDAVLIFKLLAKDRLEQSYPNVDALQEVLNQDAEMALTDCTHWIYKQTYRNRMPYIDGHQQIEQRLDCEAEAIITEWWVRKAGAAPDSKSAAPPLELSTVAEKPVMTENARRIKEFIFRTYNASERPVRKIDISNAVGYADPTMLQWFERGDPRLTKAARENFERVLAYPATEFWRCADEYRKRHPK